MLTTKIVVGTVAATVLAGTGIARMTSASSPKAQAGPVEELTRTPAVVTAPIYAPIAALPAWVEEWKADPAQRLTAALARHHVAGSHHHAAAGSHHHAAAAGHSEGLVASAPTPRTDAKHGARPSVSSTDGPKSTPVSYDPSSNTHTTVTTTRSSEGGTTTTRRTTTRTTSRNGTTRSASHTETMTKNPGTHPTTSYHGGGYRPGAGHHGFRH